MDGNNKANHVEVDSVKVLDLSPDRRHTTQSIALIATISTVGTPKNKLNKIWKEMERDNNQVAQDGVESAASLLCTGGKAVWRSGRSSADMLKTSQENNIWDNIFNIFSVDWYEKCSTKSPKQRNLQAN